MNTNGRSHWLAITIATALTACAGSQGTTTTASAPTPAIPATTASATTSATTNADSAARAAAVLRAPVAGGDVAMVDSAGGIWIDSVGGTWMDTSGGIWTHGRTGMRAGLQPSDVSGLNNQNIVAHLDAGDSLEIAISSAGAARADNPAVRDFAQRMVKDHTAHLQTVAQAGVTPMVAPMDTADVGMGARMMSQLSSAKTGSDFDAKLMRAEVVLHTHMLHDLKMLQPQATGAAQDLVNKTIPVVQRHLTDAQTLYAQVLPTKPSPR